MSASGTLAQLVAEAVEAHVRRTGESYRALAARAGFPQTYVGKLLDAVRANPAHTIESSTAERLLAAVGLRITTEPADEGYCQRVLAGPLKKRRG